MMILFTITYFILLSYCTVAQDTTGKPPSCLLSGATRGFCGFTLCDMCTLPTTSPANFNIVKEDKGISYAKNPEPATYPGDVTYKEEYISLVPKTDCQHPDLPGYASYTGNTDVLHYDVYYPFSYTKNQYINCPLPAVIFVHGGGFSDCNTINDNVFSPEGMAYAQRGFVFFNVEYRNGVRLVPSDFPTSDPNGRPYISVQQQLAEYRASQDVRGAIRSIIQRQLDQIPLSNSQKKPYQIDLNNIFLGGNSGGSITILNAAYYPTQLMVNQINPHSGTLRVEDVLGKINADYYYGDTSIPISNTIKGILAQWGSFALPPSYTSATASTFFDPSIKIPIICFHGLQDNVVYSNDVGVYFAPNDGRTPSIYRDSFNTERACLTNSPFKSKISTSPPTPPPPVIYTYGSLAYVNYILQPLGIKYELYLDCDAKHGLRNAGTVFKADYGTGYSTPDSVTLYIIGRAATFFQSIIGGTSQTATSHIKFVECKNNRVTCDMTNNYNSCMNSDNCNTHPH